MGNQRDYVRWAREFVTRELTQGGYFTSDDKLTRQEERKYKDIAACLIEHLLITFGGSGDQSIRGWVLRGRDNDAPLLIHGYWEVIFLDFNFARVCLFVYSEIHPDMPAKLAIFKTYVPPPPQPDYL